MRIAIAIIFILSLPQALKAQIPEYSNAFFLGGSSISGARGFEVLDMDHNSDADILVYTESEIIWFENQSGGSFSGAQTFFMLESQVLDLVHGDFDNNGQTDIVLLQEGEPEELVVFWDASSGNEDEPVRYQLETRGSTYAYLSFASFQTVEQTEGKTKLYLKYDNFDTNIFRELSFEEKQLTETIGLKGIEDWGSLRFGGFEVTDVNNDGFTDFIIPYAGSNSFAFNFLISNPDTSYSVKEAFFGDEYNVFGTILTGKLFVDVDGDGLKDIITSAYSTLNFSAGDPALRQSYLVWYKNVDNESFEEGIPIDFIRGGYSGMYLYDVNQDGVEDLVAQSHVFTQLANPEDEEVLKTYWYERTEESGFGERKELPGYYNQVKISDIDNDGQKDIVGLYRDELSWHRNEGMNVGNAQSIISSDLYLINPVTFLVDADQIKSTDVDGDDLNDIVIGSREGLYWYENLGDLQFSEIQEIDSELKDIKEIEFMDLNGDDKEDIIVLTSDNYFSSENAESFVNFRFYLFENTDKGFADGELIYEQSYSSETSLNVAFSLGDYDADEDTDIIFQSGNKLYWFQNEGGSYSSEPILLYSYDAESTSSSLISGELFSFRADDEPGDEVLVVKSVRGTPPFGSNTSSAVIFSFSADSGGFFILQETGLSNLGGFRSDLNIYTGNFDNDEEQELLISDKANIGINSENNNVLTVGRSILDKPQGSTTWNAAALNGDRSSHLVSPHTGITIADVDNDGNSEILSANRRYTNVNFSTPTSYSSGALMIHGINDESELTNISTIDTLRDGYTSLTTSDLNNDGYPEVIAALYNDGRLAVYGGNGAFPPVSNEAERSSLPEKLTLSQNYPNPFNPTTIINYSVSESGFVELKVFNLLGQLVQTLVDGRKVSGVHQVQFDASSLASGVYIYRLQSGNTVLNRKMVLIK